MKDEVGAPRTTDTEKRASSNRTLIISVAALLIAGGSILVWQLFHFPKAAQPPVSSLPPDAQTTPPSSIIASPKNNISTTESPTGRNDTRPGHTTEELVDKADDLLRKNDNKTALSLYEEALAHSDIEKMDSVRSRALSGKTSALLNLHLNDSARLSAQHWLDFQSTQKDKRTLAYCYFQLGTAYRSTIRSESDAVMAIHCFEKAIALDKEINSKGTEVSAFYEGIGQVLSSQKQPDKALAAYKTQLAYCLAQTGPGWDLQRGLAHYYCALTNNEMHNFAAASKEYELAITPIREHMSKETTAAIYREMANNYKKQGDKRKAQTCMVQSQKYK